VETRAVGSSGLVVGRLALGTLTWGEGPGHQTGPDEAAAQLGAFREAGGTLVDTADRYGAGASEDLLGRLLAATGARESIVLATQGGGRSPAGSGSRRSLLASLDASLDRLRTDHVDLWQVHALDPAVPLDETLAACDAAVTSGRARYAGTSDLAGWQLAAGATWQRAWPSRSPLVSAQVEYSLLERGVEREVVPAAAHTGVGLLPACPLGRGVLTGKYRRGTPADSRGAGEDGGSGSGTGSGSGSGSVAPYLDDRCTRIVDAVLTAADGLGVSPVSVALAWVRDRPGVAAPVVGARTAAQLQAALASESVTLPAEIADALSEVSAPVLGYPERPPG